MANKEHLEILWRGVEIWNKWREENPDVRPDLSEADLSGANLSGANLIEADLSQADLIGADLGGADLSGANLSGANLIQARLGGANLSGANLIEADLSQARLGGANLGGANLGGADLSQAYLSEAYLSQADLSGANLSEAYLSQARLSGANLRGADLRGANLIEAYLSQARLGGADLSQADLSGADLSEADLSQADLSGANLSQARLIGADLGGAYLSGANLSQARLSQVRLGGANLIGADLSGANLIGADLSGANLHNTSFGNVDLSEAKGLETVKHGGPSTIGIDTFTLSKGQIPESFLRGCGLADWEIEEAKLYQPDLTSKELTDIVYKIHDLRLAKPIQYYSCFISYSHADKTFARRLHDTLQDEGIRCWLDKHQMLPGDDIYEQIDRGIRHWDKILLCCSEASLTSWWVDNEMDLAFEKERQLMKERDEQVHLLIPLNLDGYMFTDGWKSGKKRKVLSRIAADLTGWQEDEDKVKKNIDLIIRALRADEGGREPPPPSRL